MEKSLQMYVSHLNYILLKYTLLTKAAEGNRRRVHTERVLYGTWVISHLLFTGVL